MITQGEWETGVCNIEDGKPDHVCVVLKENKQKIIALTGYVGAGDEPESQANANLIAAAVNACKEINPGNPQAVADSIGDMKEALKKAADYMGEQCYPEDILEEARQALAKAEQSML